MRKFWLGTLAGAACGFPLGAALESSLDREPSRLCASDREGARYQGRPAEDWIRQLRDRSPPFRQQAIQALQQLGAHEEGVVPALASMLKDPNTGIRMGTAFALRQLGAEAHAAVPQLVAALHDPDPFVRFNCIHALGSIGAHDESVRAGLVAALQDDRPEVRKAARKTLAALGPPSQRWVARPESSKGVQSACYPPATPFEDSGRATQGRSQSRSFAPARATDGE